MTKAKNLIVEMPASQNISKVGEIMVRLISEPKLISSDDADFNGTKKDQELPWVDTQAQIGLVFGGLHGEGTHVRRLNTIGYAKPDDITEEDRIEKGYEVLSDNNGIEYLCKKNKDGDYERVQSKARTEQAKSIYSQLCLSLGAKPGEEVMETLQSAHEDKCPVVANFKKESWKGSNRYNISYFRAPTEEEVENTAVVKEEEAVSAGDV